MPGLLKQYAWSSKRGVVNYPVIMFLVVEEGILWFLAERKTFKLFFRTRINLTFEVSILYFQPMRIFYAILLG